jgi:hypothetical protein
MADFDLASVLGAPQLMGAAMARTRVVPNPFPESFFQSDPEDEVVKNYGSFIRYYGQRKSAKYNPYGNPSSTVQMQNLEAVPVKLLSSSHNIVLPMAKFRGLISMDSSGSNLRIDEKGAEQIKRAVQDMAALFQNQRIAAMGMCLAADSISYDSGGNLLPSPTGAMFTVKSGVPAANQGTIGGTVTGWSTSTTNVANQLEVLGQTASKTSGYLLKKAFYGSNVRGYVMDNTNLVKYFQFNAAINTQAMAKNKIPDATLDLDWTPAYTAQYDDKNGTTQLIWSSELCVFTPDPAQTPGWLSFLQGETDVPSDIGKVGESGIDLLGSLKSVTGMYAYAVIGTDPVSIKIIMGDVMLPVLKVPGSVFQATVT